MIFAKLLEFNELRLYILQWMSLLAYEEFQIGPLEQRERLQNSTVSTWQRPEIILVIWYFKLWKFIFYNEN